MARRLGRFTLGVLTAVGAAMTAPAALGAGWLAPVALSPAGGTATQAALVPAADGALVALWLRAVGDGPSSIEYRQVGPDGTLGPVRVLSAGGPVLSFRAVRSSDGVVHVAWDELVVADAEVRVMFRRIAAEGTAGERLTLSGPGGLHPRLGAADDGTATVLWREGGSTMAAARITPDGSTNTAVLGLPGTVSPGLEHPEIAVAPDGSAVVGYLDPVAMDEQRPMAVRIPAGGNAGAPVELHPLLSVFVRGLRLAVDGTGATTAVWYRSLSGEQIVERQGVPAAGAPGLPQQLSENGAQSQFPAIVASADGLSVAWERTLGGESQIQVAVDPAPENPTPLSAPGAGAGNVALGREAGGRTIVAWQRPDVSAGPGRIQATIVGADGARGPVTTLSAAGGQAQVPAALALPAGEAAVAWEQDLPPSAERMVALAHFDARAPAVAAAIPAQAAAGTPLALSAVATDRSGAVTHTWDLGDGTQATGTEVVHTYAAAGTRTVTLTSTDAVGNSTTTSGLVRVAAPVPPPVDPSPGPGSAPDTTAPRLRAVTVRPAPARRGPVAARTTRTVTVAFRLDEAARVRLAVARTLPGRRRVARCVAPTRALVAARARPCTRTLAVGAITRPAAAGAGRVAITRLRVGGRVLAPGAYRLTLTATDAAGNRGAAVTRTLRVVPAGRA